MDKQIAENKDTHKLVKYEDHLGKDADGKYNTEKDDRKADMLVPLFDILS